MAIIQYQLIRSKKFWPHFAWHNVIYSLSISFHTLFQSNSTMAQDVSLVSHKNAFYHVKVQIVRERDIFINIFQNLLKREPKIKENAYLAI